jgi:polysaccharide export outer membrane protein
MTRKALAFVLLTSMIAAAEAVGQAQNAHGPSPGAAPAAVPVPAPNYLIGPDDVLSIVFWRDKDMSAEVVVRPDGKISLPLMNDVQAGGLTPAELRDAIGGIARRYLEDPSVTVVVKEIKSRKVFITGMVEKPGPYPLNGPTTVMQLISLAGGLKEFTDGKKILIMRAGKNGRQTAYPFNYRQVISGKNLEQNVELQPGDTVVVP